VATPVLWQVCLESPPLSSDALAWHQDVRNVGDIIIEVASIVR